MSHLFIDVHVLQSVPPSNLNRDDTGTPKTALYGGARRARVSSQAWKRAVRDYFASRKLVDPAELGVRSKKLAELLAERITAKDPSIDSAAALALAVEVLEVVIRKKLKITTSRSKRTAEAGNDTVPAGKDATAENAGTPQTEALLFLSATQLELLAEFAINSGGDLATYLKASTDGVNNKTVLEHLASSHHSVDIALFGRMVADAPYLKAEAAAQVAHAISVHPVEVESDYYAAVDERAAQLDETGAGMLGTIDFNSATLYRYASINVRQLAANLGDPDSDTRPAHTATRRAMEAFLEAFVASMPTGKINTFGNHTMPDTVLIALRTTRPISYVAAFEDPIHAEDNGHLREACDRLAAHSAELERAYGHPDTRRWVLRIGPHTQPIANHGTEVAALSELVTAAGQAVADTLDR